MQAILLSAGKGERLKPYTNNWPKCLMPINKIPLLEYWIYDLARLGVEKIIINTHYLHEELNYFILNNKYTKLIEVSYEENLLGTAGTLKSLSDKLTDEEIIIIHSDNFCNCNLDEFLLAHRNRPPETNLTMMTFDTDEPENCGIVKLNKLNIVEEFYEKSNLDKGNLANAAVYISSKSFIDTVKKLNNIQDLSNDIINKNLGKIFTWKNEKNLIDIGKIENLRKAQTINHQLNISQQKKEWMVYYKDTIIYKLFYG